MSELTALTASDGKRPKKKTLTRVRARVRARALGRMREGLSLNGRFPSDAVHPVTRYKTPRAEARADNRIRRMEAWAWSEATKRSAQRFLVERIISGRTARQDTCTSAEVVEAYAEFCQAEGLPAMDALRMKRLAAAKLPKIHAAVPVRIWRRESVGPIYPPGFRGIRIRPLTKAPRNTIAALEAAVDREGLKVHTRIVEAFFRAAVSLGWVDLTDTPESPSLRDGEDSEGRLNGGNP